MPRGDEPLGDVASVVLFENERVKIWNLIVEPGGRIANYNLRLDNHKQKTVEAFRDLNFHVMAVGDSYNDLSMIRAAHRGILFKAPDNVLAENPDLPTASNFDELKTRIEKDGEI